MRRAGVCALAIAFAGSLAACVPSDVQDPYQRTVAGALLGATAGAAIGAAVSLDPGFGAAIGTGAGVLVGGALGLATLDPPPTYAPIEIPATQIIPGFYDTWPPGNQSPALGGSVPPPPARL
jgi:hypothetical protein